MQEKKIAFVGAGNMSRAIIAGLIKGTYPGDKIYASNPSPAKLEKLKQDFNIHTTQHNAQAVSNADAVVLAVKPQMMAQVCAELAAQTDLSDKLFVSVAAGISTKRLQQMLAGDYLLVRTMPNTPAALGKGMTGLYAQPDLSAADKQFVTDLLSKVGEVLWVEQESMLDGVIAAAGSSPAYFFLFLEAMQAKAEALGFDPASARKLVQQAMLGAAETVCHNPTLELSELRAQVTSKGGTTAQAIACFEQHDLPAIVSEAMQAAVTRAEQMAMEF